MEVTWTAIPQFIILFTRQFKPSTFGFTPRLGQAFFAREQKFMGVKKVNIANVLGIDRKIVYFS